MNNIELENLAKNLIETTELAGRKSIELRKQGLKTIIKPFKFKVKIFFHMFK